MAPMTREQALSNWAGRALTKAMGGEENAIAYAHEKCIARTMQRARAYASTTARRRAIMSAYTPGAPNTYVVVLHGENNEYARTFVITQIARKTWVVDDGETQVEVGTLGEAKTLIDWNGDIRRHMHENLPA